MVLAAIALAVSTRVGQVMTLLICLAALVVGIVTDYLLSDLAQTSPLADIAYRVLPNFSFFWVVDAINNKVVIPMSYVGYVAIYAVLIAVAALLCGVALFQRREVG